MKQIIWAVVATIILAGCGKTSTQPLTNEQTADSSTTAEASVPTNVSPTSQEGSVSGSSIGKIVASNYADLSFETSLPIERVLVTNGQQVHRGQMLVQLNQYKLRNAVEQQQQAIAQAELQIEQARLQMQDVIISQGYDPDKTSSIPEDVRHNADVKSGYALSKNQLANARLLLAAAQHELSSDVLTAPFDGVVANLAVQAHQLSQPGETVCRVIATGDMQAEFRVMETDLSKYQICTRVSVIPVADKSTCYKAVVSEINPVVDEQGALTLRARIANAKNLFDGMNVEVRLQSSIDN